LSFIYTIPRVIISDTISIASTEIKMKNHNYPLPFLINRQNCYNLFRKLENWIAIYDSSWDTSVKLLRRSSHINSAVCGDLPVVTACGDLETGECEDLDGELAECEQISLYHTFIIFSTGSVTQSGPKPEEIGLYYEEFNQIIHQNKDILMLHTNRAQKKKPKSFFNYPPVVKPAFPFDKVVDC